jgi:hypothetical protein
MSDSVFTPQALANSTYTDQILTNALKGKEVRTLAPIYAPLPINALLLGILTWQVGKYFMVYGKTDSRMTKGLVASLMMLAMGTTAAVCSESGTGADGPHRRMSRLISSLDSLDVQRIHQGERAGVDHSSLTMTS